MVADISVHIGIHEVLSRPRKTRQRSGELLPIPGAIDIQHGVLENSWLRSHPAQHHAVTAFGDEQWAITRQPQGAIRIGLDRINNRLALGAGRHPYLLAWS